MTRRWLRRLAIAVLLGLSAITPAHAQEPTNPSRYGLFYPVKVPGDSPDDPQRKHGCWASHFGFGCGTFRSEMVFIFGSCRSFYGEACRTGPPSAYGPGGPPPGAGPASGPHCNCP